MIRRGLDAVMLILLMLLMTYELIGEATHEIVGIAMLVCVIAHQALNWRWYRNLTKGRFSAVRALQTAVNLALLVDLTMQFVSGVILSRHALAFLPIHGGRFGARSFHVVGAYWGMALMSIHLGLHGHMIGQMLRKGKPRKRSAMPIRAGALLAAAYGAYAMVKRQVIDYMVLRIPFVFFDFDEPLVFFMLDYAAIIVLFAVIGYGAMRAARAADARRTSHNDRRN